MAVKKLNYDEVAYFCEQLCMMLKAGMDLIDGIEIISDDISESAVKNACLAVAQGMKNGNRLDEAMAHSGVFPSYAVNMVRIGTVSGGIEEVLEGLCDYYEERAELLRTIRSAVLHPLMLLVMMTVVIIVLVVVVLPMFSDIFAQFDSRVTAMIGSTVDVAYRTGMIIMIVLFALIAAALLVACLSLIPTVRRALGRFASVFPLTRGVSAKFARAKAAKAISLMVSTGLTPEDSLEYAIRLIDDKNIKAKLTDCHKKVLDGAVFAEAIADAGIFPPLYARSLKIAYSSGSHEKAWRTISKKCTEEAERSTNALIGFIEPAIIIVLVAMIGAILLTVMIPLMNILSVLG